MPWCPIRPAIAIALIANVVCQVEGIFAWVSPMILLFLTRVFGGVGLLYPFFLVDLLEVVSTRNPKRFQVAKPSGHRFLQKKTGRCCHYHTTETEEHVNTCVYKLSLTARQFSESTMSQSRHRRAEHATLANTGERKNSPNIKV